MIFNFQKHGIASRKHYNNGKNGREISWTSNDTLVDEQQLFIDATYNLTGLLKRIYVRFIRADKDGKINTNIDDLENELDSFKEQRHRTFGRCYTFYPKKSIRDLGIYYAVFYL